MDNNPKTINTATPAQPLQPAQTPQVVQPTANVVQEPPSGNKKMIWIIAGLSVLILVIGALLYMAGGQKGTPSGQSSPKPTASPQSVETLEKDLNSTSLDDLDKEFSTVDQDLQGL